VKHEFINSLTVTERDKLAAEAVVELLPKYVKRFNFDIVERAYAIADKTLKEIERTKSETCKR
jgi:radical SAM superfamily enzyme